MSLDYIEQSAKKLKYLLMLTPLDIKDSFKIIRQKKYITNLGRLTISIIGESHTIQFKGDNINLTEILACICIKNKGLYRFATKKILIKSLKKHKLRYRYKNRLFSYLFCIKKEKINYLAANKLVSQLRAYNSNNTLLFEWYDKKTIEYRNSVPSFTFIKYKLCGANLIRTATLHFYKNESLLLTTTSEIRINLKI